MPSLEAIENAADSFGFESSWNGPVLKVRVPNVVRFRIATEEGKPKARAWFGLMPEWSLKLQFFLLGGWAGFSVGFQRRGVPWILLGVIAFLLTNDLWALSRAQRARERLFTRATELERGMSLGM